MLLKNRKKKLIRILSITGLILIMIGIVIPQSVFAINNILSYKSLNIGDIVLPGDELTEFTGSKSYVAYYMGSGKFDGLNPNTGSMGEPTIKPYFVDGNDVGGIDGYQNANTHAVLSYDEVAAKAIESDPVNDLPLGTSFAGWVFGRDDRGYQGKPSADSGVNLVPILVSYTNNQYKPIIQYIEENDSTKIYVIPSEIDGSLIYGQCRQEITKDMINDPVWNKVSNITLNAQFSEYEATDIIDIHTKITEKMTEVMNQNDITDIKKGDSVLLEFGEIKVDEYQNVRYIPQSWKVDKLHLNGIFNKKDTQTRSVTSSYQAEIPANDIGNYSVDVTWQGQILQNGQWVDIQNENNNATIVLTQEYKVYDDQPVKPDDNKPNVDNDSIEPEKPAEPDKPIVNPDESKNPDLSQQNNISQKPNINNSDEELTQKNNTNQANEVKTSDESMILLYGSLLIGGIIIMRYTKKSKV